MSQRFQATPASPNIMSTMRGRFIDNVWHCDCLARKLFSDEKTRSEELAEILDSWLAIAASGAASNFISVSGRLREPYRGCI